MGRLTLSELCHQGESGGLGLVDTERRANSLFLREACRMLNRKGSGYRHISFWLGSRLEGCISLDYGPRFLRRPPPLQLHLENLLKKAREVMSERDLLAETAKSLYTLSCQDLPEPRLQRRNPDADIYVVWHRLANSVLGVQARHSLFILANGLVRNRQDIFMKWGRGDLTCDHSPDPQGLCAGEPQSITHLFQRCARVADCWSWLSFYLTTVLPPGSLSEEQCLTLLYPKLNSNQAEDSIIWLLGTYFEYVMREALEKERRVNVEELRGYMKQRHAAHQLKRLRPLLLPGL